MLDIFFNFVQMQMHDTKITMQAPFWLLDI